MFVTLLMIVRLALTERPGGFLQQLHAGRDRIAEYFFRRSAIANLSELDDRALLDIGLLRSQIKVAVYGVVTLPGRGRPL
jgi:uncharacterized protein YjiS (DUF1127 family)